MALCLYCSGELDDKRCPKCPACNSSHHLECWDENGGCAQMGCGAGPK